MKVLIFAFVCSAVYGFIASRVFRVRFDVGHGYTESKGRSLRMTRPLPGLMTRPEDLNVEKMGMPRVIKKIESDGSEVWLMWLQGREAAFDTNSELPDLSTGRIFFMDSPDGLNGWRLHEDNPVINPNKEGDGDWWFFDAEHVGLGDVVVPGGNAASKFVTQDGVYLMYIFGGNSDKVDIGDKEMKGVRMEIGVCVSQDGSHWSRVEGANPLGSILEPGDPADFDGQMIGWPVVVEDGPAYRMYYSTYSPHEKRFIVAEAISPDGMRWSKRGRVFDGGPKEAFDGMGASRRYITKDQANSNAVYKMWYEGISEKGVHSIGLAISQDGTVWERVGNQAVFSASEDEFAWDAGGVGSPHLVWLEDRRRWRMYYVGSDLASNKFQIGVAESTDEEGLSFERLSVIG